MQVATLEIDALGHEGLLQSFDDVVNPISMVDLSDVTPLQLFLGLALQRHIEHHRRLVRW